MVSTSCIYGLERLMQYTCRERILKHVLIIGMNFYFYSNRHAFKYFYDMHECLNSCLPDSNVTNQLLLITSYRCTQSINRLLNKVYYQRSFLYSINQRLGESYQSHIKLIFLETYLTCNRQRMYLK